MTIRAKVFLFALLAVGLVCLMGIHLYVGAQKGQYIREQLTAIQEQRDAYERLHALAWPYLNMLAQTRRVEGSTALAQRELMMKVEQELALLGDSLSREEQWLDDRPEMVERDEQRQLRDAYQHWSEWAAARVRALPEGSSVGSTLEWLLYSQFEQNVGERITSMQQAEKSEMDELRRRWDHNVLLTRQLALVFPAICLVLVLALAFAILTPLQRSLRGLMAVAERIGRGDFDIQLPPVGQDELGRLTHAFDRMARELRELLEEKQRLIRAEAEASEREARRYHAMLEDTVRTRTTQLADANVRLQDSLQQLQSAQEQLLFADRLAAVGRLAAGVGHEINNPLAFILSNLRYVHQELKQLPGAPSAEDREEMINALAEASEGAERVRLIVQDLKTLSRPDDVALGPVDLAEVVRGSAKMARHEVRDRARLVEDCGEVPPVHANAARLGQVFLNLIINAAHAIEPGRVQENEIRVEARLSAPDRVTVAVRDTGAGISPENLRRIFDPFFTTKPAGVGTGLGLSVCHRIITALGGEIRVESEPGRGTCFFITLRVADCSTDAGPSSSGQSAA
ncbi:phospho-acceptor domain-containing protein [Archangium gephyra]|uniref:histidine kinase n=1 Tax=Archangium gephyra TaxID=48 RepID=A0AAC8Q198_9BACT|nr:ATP-binding protein [Archangium gephyra]AKI99074.1 Sensor histidine kinase [Archangium gephyra]REG30980.1 phospho-acceptor domain-containing protein [Archangium gephyra]